MDLLGLVSAVYTVCSSSDNKPIQNFRNSSYCKEIIPCDIIDNFSPTKYEQICKSFLWGDIPRLPEAKAAATTLKLSLSEGHCWKKHKPAQRAYFL